MPERSQGSRSSSEEQWEIIDGVRIAVENEAHVWRWVMLQSNRGQRSAGLQCLDCGLIERLSERQLRSHGQRIERSNH